MENKHKNIEDLFKSSFDNYKIEPRADLWNNVEKKVRYTNAYNTLIDFLKNYSVTPNSAVWNNISKQLFYLNFLRFNLRTFNVFYLLLIISIASGVTFYSIDKTKSEKYITENQTNKNNIGIKIESQPIKNNLNKENNQISKKQKTKDKDNQFAESEIITQAYQDKNIIKKAIEPKLNADKKITTNSTTIKNTVKKKNLEDKIKVKKNNQIKNNTINNQVTQNIDPLEGLPIASTEPLANSLISKKIVKGIKVSKPKIKTNHKTDTIYKTDSTQIKYKTIIDNNLLSKWTVDVSVSQLFSSKEISANTNEYKIVKDARNGEDKSKTTYGFNLGFNYAKKHFICQTGISSTTFGEDFNYTVNTYNIDSSEIISYTNYNKTNKYTYLEIPIILGYKFNKDKISIYTKTGVMFGILIKAKGFTVDSNNKDVIYAIDKNNNFTNPSYTLVVGAGVNIPIKSRINIFIEPLYRYNLKSIYNDTYCSSLKFKTWGITLGVRFNLQ